MMTQAASLQLLLLLMTIGSSEQVEEPIEQEVSLDGRDWRRAMFLLRHDQLRQPTKPQDTADGPNDIRLSTARIRAMEIVGSESALIEEKVQLWNNSSVPYKISGLFNRERRSMIAEAIKFFELETCVKWVDRSTETDYVFFTPKGASDCSADVGRQGGRQILRLGKRACFAEVGNVLHEMMHVIGFYHEHQRPDRDTWVHINWGNVHHTWITQFHKIRPDNDVSDKTKYDFGSLLQYHLTAGAIDEQFLTIDPQVRGVNGVIGQRTRFSYGDIIKINTLYKCNCDQFERAGCGLVPNRSSTTPTISPTTVSTTATTITTTTTSPLKSVKLWPLGRIPYSLDRSSFTTSEKQQIRAAMNLLERNTCIQFINRDKQTAFVRISKMKSRHRSFCMSSSVGATAGELILNTDCVKQQGRILHFLMHTIGFYHEESRPDRDRWVRINWANVDPAFENQLKIRDPGYNISWPYDYTSIMHSPSNFGAKPKHGQTIVPNGIFQGPNPAPGPNSGPNPAQQPQRRSELQQPQFMLIGQQQNLSDIDILKTNTLYRCNCKIYRGYHCRGG